jgi:hypothetical protein
MINETKDYSLLRAFNLVLAQAGDEIVFFTDYLPPMDVVFKGYTSDLKMVFIEYSYIGGINGKSYYTSELKMKPLTWVEGKPVYKGDVLYYISLYDNKVYSHKAFSCSNDGLWDEVEVNFISTNALTWDKPKEKHIHQELMDAHKAGAKIQCFNTKNAWMDITWEPNWEREVKYRIKPQDKPHLPKYAEFYQNEEEALVSLYRSTRKGPVEIRWY